MNSSMDLMEGDKLEVNIILCYAGDQERKSEKIDFKGTFSES